MPTIESRPEQAYVGKRALVRLGDLARRTPELTAEVAGWVERNGVEPAGRPFLRYHVIDMPDRLEVELGLPVRATPRTDAGIAPGVLPAGRYATATFTGTGGGVAAIEALIAWIAERGEEMAVRASERGDVFESRYETLLTDASAEPERERWETEIAIKLRG